MKYCQHCGNELVDEAIVCPKCGCSVDKKATRIALLFIVLIINTWFNASHIVY